jgi:hypothetical protein
MMVTAYSIISTSLGMKVMEFYPREDLSKGPFNLELSDAELWDLVRSGRLLPFTKGSEQVLLGPADPLSGDNDYVPLFPSHLKAKYAQLMSLRSDMHSILKLLAESDDVAWAKFVNYHIDYGTEPGEREEYIQKRAEELANMERKLVEIRPEADLLESEFADIANAYASLDLTGSRHAEFLMELNTAFFRRDQIEAVRYVDEPKQVQDSFSIEGRAFATFKRMDLGHNSYKWTISFDGHINNADDTYGMRYIHFLISRYMEGNDDELSSIDMQQVVCGISHSNSVYSSMSKKALSEENLSVLESFADDQEVDTKYIQDIGHKLDSLRRDHEEAVRENDTASADELRSEIEKLEEYAIQYCSIKDGKVLKVKKLNSSQHIEQLKKASKRISKYIKYALDRIIKPINKPIHEHLQASIQYKPSFKYTPDTTIKWDI